MLAVVAVSAMVVSCGPEAKGKKFGKKMAKLDNKKDKYGKSLTMAEAEKCEEAYDAAYKKHSTKEGTMVHALLTRLVNGGDVEFADDRNISGSYRHNNSGAYYGGDEY